MTISTETSAAIFTATGTDAVYPYIWSVAQDSDLVVQVVTPAGVISTLVLDDDYTVSDAGSPTGGNVTLLAGNLAAGYGLFICSDPAMLQETLLQQGAAFNPAVVMASLDLLTREVQATRRIANNGLQIPVAESLDGFTVTFPTATNRANSIPYFDDDGDLSLLTSADLSPILTSGNYIRDTFAASASPGAGLFVPGTTTALTLSQAPGTVNNAFVYFDGVYQQTATFSLAAAVITFDAAIPFGVLAVEIRQAGVLPLNTPADNSVSTASIQAAAVTLAKMAASSVGASQIVADSVITAKILNANVTLAKLAADVLALIADGAAQVGDGKIIYHSTVGAKWLVCNGASVLRASYPELFLAIGVLWGSVDGTHFTLPDMRGRSPIGVGTGTYTAPVTARALADIGGVQAHPLVSAENGPHVHAGLYTASGAGGAIGFAEVNGVAANTASSGSGTAHNTMHPYATVNFLIRALP